SLQDGAGEVDVRLESCVAGLRAPACPQSARVGEQCGYVDASLGVEEHRGGPVPTRVGTSAFGVVCKPASKLVRGRASVCEYRCERGRVSCLSGSLIGVDFLRERGTRVNER